MKALQLVRSLHNPSYVFIDETTDLCDRNICLTDDGKPFHGKMGFRSTGVCKSYGCGLDDICIFYTDTNSQSLSCSACQSIPSLLHHSL